MLDSLTYKKLADWLVPILLAATVDVLFEIKKELAGINVTLAIAMTRIDDDERRLTQLETKQDALERFSRPSKE